MPIAKLRKYMTAYNIDVGRVVEKDDLIDKIVAARGQNGCLSPQCEEYYRRYSVPSRPGVRPRGFFSSRTAADLPPARTSQPQRQAAAEFARPDLAPDDPPPVPPRPQQSQPRYNAPPQQQQRPPAPPPRQQWQQYSAPPRPPPPQQSQQHSAPPRPPPQSTRPQARYAPPTHPPPSPRHSFPPQGAGEPYHQSPSARSSHNLNVPRSPPQQRQRATSHTPTPTPPPPPPPPSLDQLLEMPEAAIGALSISNLKAVLFSNHVNARMILEKGELVKKVNDLVAAERADRERARMLEQQEEQERIRVQRDMMEALDREKREHEERLRREHRPAEGASEGGDAAGDATSREAETPGEGDESAKPPPPPPAQTKPTASAAFLERTGLCVICQDEEANIAIVDCGHLAMCRGCSDLIMAGSRECPLCRTRIVTEARLLRIFKT
ncbi:hypothetical protein HGRIS_011668 [Hohenbuehelia grisea]